MEEKDYIEVYRHTNRWWWGHSVDIVKDDGTAIVCVKFDEKSFPKGRLHLRPVGT